MNLAVITGESFYGVDRVAYPDYWAVLGYLTSLADDLGTKKISVLSRDPERDSLKIRESDLKSRHELLLLEQDGYEIEFLSLQDQDLRDYVVIICHLWMSPTYYKKIQPYPHYTQEDTFDFIKKTLLRVQNTAGRMIVHDADGELFNLTKSRGSYLDSVYPEGKRSPIILSKVTGDISHYKSHHSIYDTMIWWPLCLSWQRMYNMMLSVRSTPTRPYDTVFIGGYVGRPHVIEIINQIQIRGRVRVSPGDNRILSTQGPRPFSHNRCSRDEFISTISQGLYYIQGASWFRKRDANLCNRYTSKLIEGALSGTLVIGPEWQMFEEEAWEMLGLKSDPDLAACLIPLHDEGTLSSPASSEVLFTLAEKIKRWIRTSEYYGIVERQSSAILDFVRTDRPFMMRKREEMMRLING
jgi:hypothetical protein